MIYKIPVVFIDMNYKELENNSIYREYKMVLLL
jgi:hypothetical protein